MKKALHDYYRSIRRCLPCPRKRRQQIMDSIEQTVNAYLHENSGANFAAVQQHFGTPQQIAAAYIDEMTPAEILKRYKTKKVIITTVCVAVIIIVVIWLSAIGIALVNELTQADGYYDVGDAVVEELEENK